MLGQTLAHPIRMRPGFFGVLAAQQGVLPVLDDILEFFTRHKRQRRPNHGPVARNGDLPFDLSFLDADDEDDERDRPWPENERRAARRPSRGRAAHDGDWD